MTSGRSLPNGIGERTSLSSEPGVMLSREERFDVGRRPGSKRRRDPLAFEHLLRCIPQASGPLPEHELHFEVPPAVWVSAAPTNIDKMGLEPHVAATFP